MSWARIHPYVVNWPADCAPPVFTISADQPGSVVVELAWDPQALAAPADYPEGLRYYSTADTVTTAGLNLPPQPITLTGQSVDWTVPAALWTLYTAEAAKVFTSPPGTTFACNLYYRVRVTPTAGGPAAIWPSDEVLGSAAAAAAPHIGVLTASATDNSPIPDPAALAAAGGPPSAPAQWSDLVRWCWVNLPGTDPTRAGLSKLFTHNTFRTADTATKGQLLALWMLAGSSRPTFSDLLDATTFGGKALLGTKASNGTGLLQGLLALAQIIPHPELGAVLAKEQLIDDVIGEILDPNGQLDLGYAGTTSATALQAWLIGVNPAEYVRLQAGLLSPAATTTLADGTALSVPVGAFRAIPEATPLGGNVFVARRCAEFAFTAAVLGRVSAFPGDPDPVKANAALQAAVSAGLYIADAAAVLTGLFGTAVTPRNVSWPPQPDVASWQWEQDAVRDSLLEVLADERSALVYLFWATRPDVCTHAVIALRQDGSDVVLRNAQYAGSSAPGYAVAGGNADLPPRNYRDPAHALETMTTDDVGAWILGYLAPATPLEF